jgi:hypothetical protein
MEGGEDFKFEDAEQEPIERLPEVGFFCAESGKKIPLAVFSSSSATFTTILVPTAVTCVTTTHVTYVRRSKRNRTRMGESTHTEREESKSERKVDEGTQVVGASFDFRRRRRGRRREHAVGLEHALEYSGRIIVAACTETARLWLRWR